MHLIDIPFAAAISLAVLAPNAASASTSFGFSSSPQSFIGQGQTQNLTPRDGYQMGVFLEFNNTVHFYAIGHNSAYNPWRNLLPPGFKPKPTDPSSWWEVAVGVGGGSFPAVGEYIDPTGSPRFSDPFISFIGNFRASNQTSGSFNIRELEVDSGGAITAFALDFTHFGEDNPTWRDRGYVRYNSTLPAPIPEPATALLFVSGLFALAGVRRIGAHPGARRV